MITGMFSYYQESKSTKIMETFNELLPQKAVALRDSERRELNVTELVPGDIVLIETGDRVPADIRILECQGKTFLSPLTFLLPFLVARNYSTSGLKVDNASITGESIPVLRSSMASGGSILESKNMIFFSTDVIEGKR